MRPTDIEGLMIDASAAVNIRQPQYYTIKKAIKVEVEDVKFVDGLLTITLVKHLPEKQKRKKWF